MVLVHVFCRTSASFFLACLGFCLSHTTASADAPALPVMRSAALHGFVDKTGKMVITPIYDQALDFSEGFAAVCKNGKWGYIDTLGNSIIPFQFTACEQFSEGLAGVYSNGKFGYIDKTGTYVIEPHFDAGSPFREGMALAESKSKDITTFSLITPSGVTIAAISTSSCMPPSNGLFAAYNEKTASYSFVSCSGKILIPGPFEHVAPFSCGYATVAPRGENRKYCYIDQGGKQTTPTRYVFAASFSEGLARVSTGKEHFFIDGTGKNRFNRTFEEADDFREGLAAVMENKRWGYINGEGRYVIDPRFFGANAFSEGVARVSSEPDKFAFIDRSGKTLFSVFVNGFKVESVGNFFNGRARVAIQK